MGRLVKIEWDKENNKIKILLSEKFLEIMDDVAIKSSEREVEKEYNIFFHPPININTKNKRMKRYLVPSDIATFAPSSANEFLFWLHYNNVRRIFLKIEDASIVPDVFHSLLKSLQEIVDYYKGKNSERKILVVQNEQ